jgi:aryl-alcohol dehydrogenase-like predicted oxidoreductase
LLTTSYSKEVTFLREGIHMEIVEFGNTGLKVSRLSIGTGTHGWAHRSEQTALGLDGLARLLQQGYDLGVNFWDLADQYGSHPHVARALKAIPRDKVVIATKTGTRDHNRIKKDIDRFLKELNTDVIDIVLLHFMTQGNWPQRYAEAMDTLTRVKQAGKIRALGVSCHGLGALQSAAETPWTEVVLVRINYAGNNMDGKPEKVTPVIQQLYKSGKAVYGMKVLGCGNLSRDPGKAIAYVLNLGTVYAMTIGTSSTAQLQANVKHVNALSPKYPLKERT